MQHDNKGSDKSFESAAWTEAGLKALTLRLHSALAGTGVEDIRIFATLPSTSTLLMQGEFDATPRAPVLCWALQQTSGRGRRGRNWMSDPHQALTFSMAFETWIHPDAALSSLSPASGLALAAALDGLSAPVRVKWPNDLWRKERKFTGILLEACTRGKIQRVVIGVGINLYWPEDQDIAGTDRLGRAAPVQTPGGLFDVPAQEHQRLAVLAASVSALARLWAGQVANPGQQPDFSAWPAYDALAGREVAIYNDQQMIAGGINAGIASDGRFLLRPVDAPAGADAVQGFEIGEVSMRPRLPKISE